MSTSFYLRHVLLFGFFLLWSTPIMNVQINSASMGILGWLSLTTGITGTVLLIAEWLYNGSTAPSKD